MVIFHSYVNVYQRLSQPGKQIRTLGCGETWGINMNQPPKQQDIEGLNNK